MSSSPRPQYFVAREDGTLTPLIAVDELPLTLQIAGAPATISPAGTQNMVSLGLKERSSHRYTVSFLGHADSIATASAATSSVEELRRPVEEIGVPATRVMKKGGLSGIAGVENWRRGVKSNGAIRGDRESVKNDDGKVEETSKEIHKKVNGLDEESKPSGEAPKVVDGTPSMAAGAGAGTKGTLGRKMYCTHWIRWGECDYTQQGCLYKHEMPDEDKLQEIGIATYPRWYRIAHPEKFGGFTEVPEWHRRPGPAPTDQLWRGGAMARGTPLSFDEFRLNATVQRPPTNNQAPNMGGPTFFALSTYPANFHPWGGGFIQQQQHQQQPRQQWNKAPVPRVVNMDPPFVKKSAPNSATTKHDAGTTSDSTAQGAIGQGGSVAAQSGGSVGLLNHSSNHTTQSAPQPSPPATQPADAGSETINTVSQHSPYATSSIYANQQENNSGAKSNPVMELPETSTMKQERQTFTNASNEGHSATTHSQPALNGGQSAAGTRNNSTSSAGLRADSAVNVAYRPLVPSRTPQQQTANNGSAQQENGFKKPETTHVPRPRTPQPVHRRFFVPAGESNYVTNPVISPPEKPTRGGGSAERARKSKKDGNRMIISEVLLDV